MNVCQKGEHSPCFALLNLYESQEKGELSKNVAWENFRKQAWPQILQTRIGVHWFPKLTSKLLPLLIP